MKRFLYMMALAILPALSCQKNELWDADVPEDEKHCRTLVVSVADDDQTRVGFDENNEFYWHRGDKVSVLTAAGFREMILDDRYHGKTSGVFTGVFTGEMNDYVMYPSGAHVEENGQITYELPTSYTYSTIEDGANSFNPPMFGLINGGDAMLTHLASFIKISVDNIPAGGDDMKFIKEMQMEQTDAIMLQ